MSATLSIRTVQRWSQVAALLVLVAHLAGVVGLQWELTRPLFLRLVPFNLLLTASLLLYFHRDWNRSFALVIGFVAAGGFLAEVVGVTSGLIFGQYAYGGSLGLKWLNVPLLIGVNWLVLVYCIGTLVNRWRAARGWQAVGGALLMVALDWLIEPVAIRNDFWGWQTGEVPIHNYLGWFFVSLPLFWVFLHGNFRKDNPLALPVLISQVLFFLFHCVTYWLT